MSIKSRAAILTFITVLVCTVIGSTLAALLIQRGKQHTATQDSAELQHRVDAAVAARLAAVPPAVATSTPLGGNPYTLEIHQAEALAQFIMLGRIEQTCSGVAPEVMALPRVRQIRQLSKRYDRGDNTIWSCEDCDAIIDFAEGLRVDVQTVRAQRSGQLSDAATRAVNYAEKLARNVVTYTTALRNNN